MFTKQWQLSRLPKITAFPLFFKHKKLEQCRNIAYVLPSIKF